ncbi:hypothetical protein Nepgr_021240 [Nepenthes gracilis]|uniref:Calcineurin-like phosphoesterase domain-containing protein n=1 Tax=Nepenthes gracilis TaxID=150966 RepID=A0AAD3SZ67_NEPGR|nr:hypothetical protein Nepgr_021240 [Nepenthes gracilis]
MKNARARVDQMGKSRSLNGMLLSSIMGGESYLVIPLVIVAICVSFGTKLTVSAELRFKSNGEFKILQVADMHYADGETTPCLDVLPSQVNGCSDLNTTAFVERLIRAENPDLIVFTGDNIYGRDATDAAKSLDASFAPAVLSNVPWAAVLGNHDQEGTLSRQGVMKHIVSMKNTLSQLNPPEMDVIDGFGNYNLEVAGVEGSAFQNKSVLNLYFLDSGDYSTVPSITGYGWIKVSQQFWFEQTSRNLRRMYICGPEPEKEPAPGLAYFHIPLPEYASFDSSNFTGVKQEAIDPALVNSGFFTTMLEAGDVKAVLTGHDHKNDFCAELSGIYLCYAGGSGYHAYGRIGWPRRARVVAANLEKTEKGSWGAVKSIRTWKLLDDEELTAIDRQVLWSKSSTVEHSPNVHEDLDAPYGLKRKSQILWSEQHSLQEIMKVAKLNVLIRIRGFKLSQEAETLAPLQIPVGLITFTGTHCVPHGYLTSNARPSGSLGGDDETPDPKESTLAQASPSSEFLGSSNAREEHVGFLWTTPVVWKESTMAPLLCIVLLHHLGSFPLGQSVAQTENFDYDRIPPQNAIWHFPSLVLLKWCDDVQTVPCHAIRGMRSDIDPVHNVLNLLWKLIPTTTGKRGYRSCLLRFLLLNEICWLGKCKYICVRGGGMVAFQIVKCIHNFIHQMERIVLMASFQLYKGIAEFMQGVAFQKNLQLDYIDLYIIQWPVRKKKNFMTSELENTIPVDIPSTWKTMKAVYDSGKAKVLDISKLYMKELGELLAIARAPPAINRAQCHPSWQQNKPHEFQSPVFVRAKERSAEVAYLEDMYEKKREHKKVQVRWFLMLTVKIFNIDTNVVQETGRTRNVREQQYFLKIHSGTEHGKKTTYEQLCQDITYYMSARGLFLPLNVEKCIFMEVCSQSTHPIHSHTDSCAADLHFPLAIKSTFIKQIICLHGASQKCG